MLMLFSKKLIGHKYYLEINFKSSVKEIDTKLVFYLKEVKAHEEVESISMQSKVVCHYILINLTKENKHFVLLLSKSQAEAEKQHYAS